MKKVSFRVRGTRWILDDNELVTRILREIAEVTSEILNAGGNANESAIELVIAAPSQILRDYYLDRQLESEAREQFGSLLSARRTK